MLAGREELRIKWHSGVSASISMQTPERKVKDGTCQCFLIQQIFENQSIYLPLRIHTAQQKSCFIECVFMLRAPLWCLAFVKARVLPLALDIFY